MTASRRVIESSQSPYRSAVLDAAVERQQRRESAEAASQAPPPMPPIVASPRRRNREAHLEATVANPDASLRASALETLVGRLATDGNFARKISKDARRALEGEDYLNDDEKRTLATLDAGRMSRLVDVTRRYKAIAAANERGQFGPTPTRRPSDYFGSFDRRRRDGGMGAKDDPLSALLGTLIPGRGHGLPGHGVPIGGAGWVPGAGFGFGGGDGTIGGPNPFGIDFGAGNTPSGPRGMWRRPSRRVPGASPPPIRLKGGDSLIYEPFTNNAGRSIPPPPKYPGPIFLANPDGSEEVVPADERSVDRWKREHDAWVNQHHPNADSRSRAEAYARKERDAQRNYERDREFMRNAIIMATAIRDAMKKAEEKRKAEEQKKKEEEENNKKKPSPKGSQPNPDDDGDGPVGPWVRTAALGSGRSMEAHRVSSVVGLRPSEDDAGGPGPLGPWLRGTARAGLRVNDLRPTDDDTGPIGPWSRGASQAVSWSREAMPNPDDPDGDVGPNI